MTSDPLVETLAQIARRERIHAVEDGDYLWAVAIAVLENQARRFLASDLKREMW